jgi:hypothetical protein
MSLLSQLEAFVTDGTIAKTAKPRKPGKPKKPFNPNTAVKYTRPGHRLPGERHGFVPMPKPKPFIDNRRIVEGKFVPIKPKTYKEETGQKSVTLLTGDDVSAFKDICTHLRQGLMDTTQAAELISFTLKTAQRIDGDGLAILHNQKDED